MTRKPENVIQAETLLRCGALPDVRLFRNSVGEAWVGRTAQHTGDTITLLNPRRVTFGLCPGAADLIGIRRIVVTEEMLGQTIGQLVALEEKTATGRARDDQRRFLDAMRRMGALAEVSRSADHAHALLTAPLGQLVLA